MICRVFLIPLARRLQLFGLTALLSCASLARAQFTPTALENAPTLETAIAALNAQAAQPSSHLLLDVPDITLPGPVKLHLSSELRGTSTLVLLRGKFKAVPTAAAAIQAPPAVAKKTIGERPAEQPPTVWLGSAPFKAGEPARLDLSFDIERTETLTLLALVQGRWWFVTREIKVGQAPATATH